MKDGEISDQSERPANGRGAAGSTQPITARPVEFDLGEDVRR